jgi:hypothetical protein
MHHSKGIKEVIQNWNIFATNQPTSEGQLKILKRLNEIIIDAKNLLIASSLLNKEIKK